MTSVVPQIRKINAGFSRRGSLSAAEWLFSQALQ
jgi:hypothetical protein